MLRPLIAILLLLISAAGSPQPVFPTGSSFGLIPPPGYRPSQGFIGFEGPGQGEIIFAELPPEAFAALRDGMNREALAARGMQEIERQEVPLNGQDTPALLIETVAQLGNQRIIRWLLLVPNAARTGLITANLPSKAPTGARAAMRKALSSTVVRSSVSLQEQRATLPFRFADRPSLTLQRVVSGGAAILSPPGAPIGTPGHLEWPSMVIASGAGPPVATQELATFAIAALHGIRALRDLTITDIPEETRFAGLPAILLQAEASGSQAGGKLKIAQWLAVLPNGGRIAAIAQSPADGFDAAWPDFKAVAESVEIR